jgi:hypothetical protein
MYAQDQVCLGSSCHTYGQNVNTENQCLYLYKLYYMEYYLYKKTSSTLSTSSSKTPTPQAIDQGRCKLLEEIFIVEIHIISIF